MLSIENDLDRSDFEILRRLSLEARASWAELGALIGMTGPAAAERVRKLEERGVLRGFRAELDAPALGYGLLAFVAVTLERPQHRKAFLAHVAALVEVQECHHVAGDDDYLLKVRCRDTADLERVVGEEIKGIAGVARTRTTIVLSSAKETFAVPLPAAKRKPGSGRT